MVYELLFLAESRNMRKSDAKKTIASRLSAHKKKKIVFFLCKSEVLFFFAGEFSLTMTRTETSALNEEKKSGKNLSFFSLKTTRNPVAYVSARV